MRQLRGFQNATGSNAAVQHARHREPQRCSFHQHVVSPVTADDGRPTPVPRGSSFADRETLPIARGQSLLRLGRFYLMSLLYGAAVYGFIVAYLLVLGAMTEPMPTYSGR